MITFDDNYSAGHIPVNSIAQPKEKKSKSHKPSKGEKIQLFNGKDLSNWVFKLKDPAADPSKVFTVTDGSNPHFR